MSRGLPYDSDARPRLRRRAHRADDRRGLRAVGAHRARPRRSVRRLREEPRAVPARDAQAPRRDARRQRAATCRPISTPRRKQSWDDAVELGEEHGYRNAQATVLAPTGTIGFMMDCDTTGVEPDIALVKYKKLVGGGMMKIVNQTVPMALQQARLHARRGRRASSTTSTSNETIEGAPRLQGGAPAGVRLRVQGGQGRALDPLHGPHQDDGRHAAVHLGRDQQDRQRAEGGDRRRDHAGLHRVVEARAPRRSRSTATAASGRSRSTRRRTRRRPSVRRRGGGRGRAAAARAPPAAGRAPGASRTSSTSRATKATSRSACSRTGSPARSSW